MTTTTNLDIPLIGGTTKFAKEGTNAALQKIDENALPISHKTSVMHLPIWEPGKQYVKGAIVRSNNCPTWGILEAISTTGTSGTVEPTASTVGDVITDNSVTWKLEKLSGGFSVHNDLSGRDAEDAHPIESITGLEIYLANLMTKTEYTESGVITYPTIVDNGDGSISISGGSYNLYADSSGTLPLTQYTQIGTKTLTLVDKADNFLCAYLNNGIVDHQFADRSTINYSNIVIISSMFRYGTLIDQKPWSTYAKNLAGMLLKRLNRTNRFPYESGLSLGESSGRIVTLTSGIVWFATREIYLAAFNSSTDEMWQMVLSSGVWSSTQVTQYNNSQYNASAGLVDLGNNKYNVTWVFRDVTDTAKRIFLVLGTGSYSLAEAKDSPKPSLPSIISTQTVLVGRIICQKSATTATSIETAFGVNFSGTSSSNASDISIADAGSYYTGSDVETALQEVGSVKHSHTNKTQLDKISEDGNGSITYNGLSIAGGIKIWTTGTEYKVNDLISYNEILYRCLVAHTATTFAADNSKWSQLVASIPMWVTGIYYPANSVVYYDKILYKCETSHTSTSFTADFSNWSVVYSNIRKWEPGIYYYIGDIVINYPTLYRCSTAHTSQTSFNTSEESNWDAVTQKTAIIAEWEPSTSYSVNNAVIYNDVIYLCNTSHTSSSTFEADMVVGSEKWRTINTSSTVGDWLQVTKLGATAGQLVDITINNTLTFIMPPIEILKFVAGAQDQVITEFNFSSGDGSSFNIDGSVASSNPYVVFDGTVHPVNTYSYQMVKDTSWTSTGQYSEDTNIDDTLFKTIELASISISASYLLRTSSNVYYSYSTGTWVNLGTPANDTELVALFISYGTSSCPTQSQIELIGTGLSRPIRCVYQPTAGDTVPTVVLAAVPKDKLLLPKALIGIDGFDGIDNMTPTYVTTGYDASLLHFDTDFTDESGIIWTPTGTPTISATQSKFGGKSLYLDGSSYLISPPNMIDFNFGTGDFTIRGFFYNTTTTQYQTIFSTSYDYTISGSLRISTGPNGDSIQIATGSTALYTGTATFSLNVWNEFSLSRKAGITYVGLNGIIIGSFSDTNNYSLSQGVIGAVSGNTNYYFRGYLDEIEVIKGVGVYSTNYSPPTIQAIYRPIPKIKFVITKDLTTYYTFNTSTSAFEVIDHTNLATVLSSGIDVSTLASITRAQWDTFTTSIAGIGIGFLLNESSSLQTCKLDNLSFQVDMKGSWNHAVYGTDVTYGYPKNNLLRVTLITAGDYKINYNSGTIS